MSNNNICGEDHVKFLDNGFRRMFHNPEKMFKKYILPGNTVIDIGCGPGTFTVGLANLTGPEGKTIAVDLQESMLEHTKRKVEAEKTGSQVVFHKCANDSLELDEKADFILTFYMVHETPDPIALIDEISGLLKPGGIYYLAEPKFHVSKKQYHEVLLQCKKNGLSIIEEKGIICRIAVLEK